MSIFGYVIRRASPVDADRVVSVINAVAAEYCWLSTEQYRPNPPWERVLHQSHEHQDHLLLVPEARTKILGWCRIFPYSFPKSRHVADLGIGIAKEFRNKGIGTALVLRGLEWAVEHGYEKVTLDTFSSNTPAIRLFQKMGFQITGVRYSQAKISGQLVDQILMEKFL